jgi:hypothetical protein
MMKKDVFYPFLRGTNQSLHVPETVSLGKFHVAPVIAYPQGKAIYTGMPDGFTLQIRDNVAAGGLHKSPSPLSAFPMTTQVLRFATI